MPEIEKPRLGAPCNGCGLCCRAVVCSAGSFTLGLVEAYGDRAPGPCPAIVEKPDGSIACGMVERPRDHAPGRGGAHELRAAISIMIGAGAGCDEADGRPDDDERIAEIQERFLARHGVDGINRAVARWFGLENEK